MRGSENVPLLYPSRFVEQKPTCYLIRLALFAVTILQLERIFPVVQETFETWNGGFFCYTFHDGLEEKADQLSTTFISKSTTS